MSPQVTWNQTRKVRRRLDPTSPSSESSSQGSPIASPTRVLPDQLQQQLNEGSLVQGQQLIGQVSSFPVGSFTHLLSGVGVSSQLFELGIQPPAQSLSAIRTNSHLASLGQLQQQSQQTSFMGAQIPPQEHGDDIYQHGATGTTPQLIENEPSTMQSLHTAEFPCRNGTSVASNRELIMGHDTSFASNGELILGQADLPSGSALVHEPNVRDDSPDDEVPFVDPLDDQDPGTLVGRGCNHYPDEQNLKANRIHISLSTVEMKFIPEIANATISGLLRTLYRGDTQWDNVSKQTRNKLWCAFNMRFRWDDDKNRDVAKLWNKLNRYYFVYMMSHAKRTWKNEKVRTKWCPINYYHKLIRYWNSVEVIELALRNSTNRGVIRNNQGQVVKQAGATFTGGPASMLSRDLKKLGTECSKKGFILGNYILTHMTTDAKNKRKRKGKKRAETTGASSQAELDVATSHEPQWINNSCQQILERYNMVVNEKYADNPQDKPSVWDPRDEECWAIVAGGPSKGKVTGVSKHAVLEKFGYTNVKRRTLGSDVHLNTDSVHSTLVKALDDQRLFLPGEFDQKL